MSCGTLKQRGNMSKVIRADNAVHFGPPSPPFNDEYLRQPAAAKFLGVSEGWLEKDRVTGRSGLKFYRLPNSRTILYRTSDLNAWVMQGARISTSDRGGAQ